VSFGDFSCIHLREWIGAQSFWVPINTASNLLEFEESSRDPLDVIEKIIVQSYESDGGGDNPTSHLFFF
jgi:hypothetical protein